MRARKAAAVLSDVAPDEAVTLLGALVRRADRRNDPEAAALEGLLLAVRDLLPRERVEALYHAAGDDLEVQALFARSEARGAASITTARNGSIARCARAPWASAGRWPAPTTATCSRAWPRIPTRWW